MNGLMVNMLLPVANGAQASPVAGDARLPSMTNGDADFLALLAGLVTNNVSGQFGEPANEIEQMLKPDVAVDGAPFALAPDPTVVRNIPVPQEVIELKMIFGMEDAAEPVDPKLLEILDRVSASLILNRGDANSLAGFEPTATLKLELGDTSLAIPVELPKSMPDHAAALGGSEPDVANAFKTIQPDCLSEADNMLRVEHNRDLPTGSLISERNPEIEELAITKVAVTEPLVESREAKRPVEPAVSAIENDDSEETRGWWTSKSAELAPEYGVRKARPDDELELTISRNEKPVNLEETPEIDVPKVDPVTASVGTEPDQPVELKMAAQPYKNDAAVTQIRTPASEPVVLTVTDDNRLVLSGDVLKQIESLLPQAKATEIVSNAEITVKQVLVVADPVKFAKHVLAEIDSTGKQPTASSGQSERVEIQPSSDVLTKQDFDAEDSPGNGGQKKPDFKLDVGGLMRKSDSHVFKPVQNGQDVSVESHSVRSAEAVQRSEVVPKMAELSMPEMPREMPKISTEPVRFRVIMPESGMKITEVSSFRMNLEPESLGQVRVHLTMADDILSARLAVDNAVAKQAVEANLPALKDALLEYGIKVEEFSVDLANSGDQQNRYAQSKDDATGGASGEKFSLDSEGVESTQPEGIRIPVRGNLQGSISLLA